MMRLTSQAGGLPAMFKRYCSFWAVSALTRRRPRLTRRSPSGPRTRSANGCSISDLSEAGALSSAWIAATDRATPRRSWLTTPMTERLRVSAANIITAPSMSSDISDLDLRELEHEEPSDGEQH